MKKLRFIFSVILILLFTSIYNLSVSQNASLTICGRVLPRVTMSISEKPDSRSINSKTGTENLQIFTINNSSNLRNGYQVVVESQDAAANQTDGNFQSNLEITKISQESNTTEGLYKVFSLG